MFKERLEVVNKQMEELQKTLETIQYKYWYYGAAGSEYTVKNMPIEEIPEEVLEYRIKHLKS